MLEWPTVVRLRQVLAGGPIAVPMLRYDNCRRVCRATAARTSCPQCLGVSQQLTAHDLLLEIPAGILALTATSSSEYSLGVDVGAGAKLLEGHARTAGAYPWVRVRYGALQRLDACGARPLSRRESAAAAIDAMRCARETVVTFEAVESDLLVALGLLGKRGYVRYWLTDGLGGRRPGGGGWTRGGGGWCAAGPGSRRLSARGNSEWGRD